VGAAEPITLDLWPPSQRWCRLDAMGSMQHSIRHASDALVARHHWLTAWSSRTSVAPITLAL
jgi:hypothetical protein